MYTFSTTEIEIRTPPLNADFDQKISICSYFLKFSLKSKFMVLLFSKIPSKKFCLRRKISTHFFRLRCYFTLYTGSKPCKTGPKKFACGAKWSSISFQNRILLSKFFACGAKLSSISLYKIAFYLHFFSPAAQNCHISCDRRCTFPVRCAFPVTEDVHFL